MKRLLIFFALTGFCISARAQADIPLPEYPRPQMVRPQWHNLNGQWNYAILDKDEKYNWYHLPWNQNCPAFRNK